MLVSPKCLSHASFVLVPIIHLPRSSVVDQSLWSQPSRLSLLSTAELRSSVCPSFLPSLNQDGAKFVHGSVDCGPWPREIWPSYW